jgi:large subunit ribosomal protein L4
MYEAKVFTAEGKKAKGSARPLPDAIFDGTVHEAAMWQAAKAYLANQRNSNASTRNRSRVRGGARKPWRQKGTGRARQGTIRAPQWRGGGVVFGPTSERNHRQELPRKVRGLARRSALNARAREGSLLVIDGVDLEAPKTAQVVGLLDSLGLAGKKVLVLTHGIKRNVYLSCRNLPGVDVLPFPEASAYHVLWADALVVEGAAIGADSGIDALDEAPAPTAGRKKAAPKAKAESKAKAAPKGKAKAASKPKAGAMPAAKAAKPKAPAKKKESE